MHRYENPPSPFFYLSNSISNYNKSVIDVFISLLRFIKCQLVKFVKYASVPLTVCQRKILNQLQYK
jgi:hypothetical protein